MVISDEKLIVGLKWALWVISSLLLLTIIVCVILLKKSNMLPFLNSDQPSINIHKADISSRSDITHHE